jgi:tetratricopeptide (TPR) repeat protein
MPTASYMIYSRLYQHFKAIEPSDFRRIASFFEQNKKHILKLDGEEYVEIMWAYSKSLFEMADYQQCIRLSDELIRFVMEHNILTINGIRIFETLLFQKGAAFMNERQYDKAVYVLEELIKITPHDAHVELTLQKAMHGAKPELIRRCRATAIVLWLTTAFLVIVERLLIQNFYKPYQKMFINGYCATFGMAILVWTGGYLLQHWRVHRVVNQHIKAAKRKKSLNEDRHLINP